MRKFKLKRGSEFEIYLNRKKKNAEYLKRLDDLIAEEDIF